MGEDSVFTPISPERIRRAVSKMERGLEADRKERTSRDGPQRIAGPHRWCRGQGKTWNKLRLRNVLLREGAIWAASHGGRMRLVFAGRIRMEAFGYGRLRSLDSVSWGRAGQMLRLRATRLSLLRQPRRLPERGGHLYRSHLCSRRKVGREGKTKAGARSTEDDP